MADVTKKPEPLTEAESLYILAESQGEHFKVGRSSDPSARAARIAAASPREVICVLAVEGGAFMESAVHHMFAAEAVGNEWCAGSTRMRDFVDRLIDAADEGWCATADLLFAMAHEMCRRDIEGA